MPSTVVRTVWFRVELCRVQTPPGKSWIFRKICRPGKSWKMGLVLEILVQVPVKSRNFLGYDVGGGHNDAGADVKICVFTHLSRTTHVNNGEKFTDNLFAISQ